MYGVVVVIFHNKRLDGRSSHKREWKWESANR